MDNAFNLCGACGEINDTVKFFEDSDMFLCSFCRDAYEVEKQATPQPEEKVSYYTLSIELRAYLRQEGLVKGMKELTTMLTCAFEDVALEQGYLQKGGGST